MGNQRELLQVSPRRGRGAILQLRAGASGTVEQILAASTPFYAALCRRGDALQFPNLDGPETDEGIASADHLTIQSGGKMWCGYEYFVDRVRVLAPSLEDALFYVGDEVDYVDEFRIERGALIYARVHSGCWWDLEQYLNERELPVAEGGQGGNPGPPREGGASEGPPATGTSCRFEEPTECAAASDDSDTLR